MTLANGLSDQRRKTLFNLISTQSYFCRELSLDPTDVKNIS